MISYIFFYSFTLLLAVLGQSNIKYQNFFWYSILFTVVSFVGLRDEVGQDFIPYKEIYESGIIYDFNYGGILFNYFIIQLKSYEIDFSFFIYVSSAAYFIAVFLFIKNFSENKFLSLMFFVLFPITFLSSMSGIRQAWALSFIIIGVLGYYRDNRLLYFICALCSMACHATAVVFFVYFFFVRKLKLSYLVIVSIIGLLMIFAALPFIQSLMTMGLDYLKIENKSASLKDVVLSIALTSSVVFFISLRKGAVSQKSDFVLKTSLIGCFIVLFSKFTGVVSEAFMRLAIYFLWCYPVFIADSFLEMRLTVNTRLFASVIIIIFFIFYSLMSISGNEALTPYQMKAIS